MIAEACYHYPGLTPAEIWDNWTPRMLGYMLSQAIRLENREHLAQLRIHKCADPRAVQRILEQAINLDPRRPTDPGSDLANFADLFASKEMAKKIRTALAVERILSKRGINA